MFNLNGLGDELNDLNYAGQYFFSQYLCRLRAVANLTSQS